MVNKRLVIRDLTELTKNMNAVQSYASKIKDENAKKALQEVILGLNNLANAVRDIIQE